ncbi:hypothetical protein D9757_004956 [Collybiopsis confluens]|uniref:Iron-sulfur clusters transporter ATM1, mitochondrial n=1 Tax=Collybiopsis confluens TaxID=2823264 RepID=A0A8H5HT69_9AGAR|nr:hypothetical protein D9757_004956 [Collybiopsis confluens]
MAFDFFSVSGCHLASTIFYICHTRKSTCSDSKINRNTTTAALIILFGLSTAHVSINFARGLQAFAPNHKTLGGASIYLEELWVSTNVVKQILFVTAMWALIWWAYIAVTKDGCEKFCKLLFLPGFSMLASIVCGYNSVNSVAHSLPGENAFIDGILRWRGALLALSLLTNTLVVMLIALMVKSMSDHSISFHGGGTESGKVVTNKRSNQDIQGLKETQIQGNISARTRVQRRNSEADPDAVGEELRTNTYASRLPRALEGTLLRRGARLNIGCRLYQNQAAPQPKPERSPQPNPSGPNSLEPAQLTAAQERKSNWKIIRSLMSNVWPKNDWKTRGTVILGFAFLISGKVLNVQVPLIFKQIIDSLNIPLDPSSSSTIWTIAGATVLGCKTYTFRLRLCIVLMYPSIDGAARVGATVFSELLNAVFANIGQRAIRKVARETFEQLLSMDMKFHLARQTGGLTRAIDRGTKGITFLLQAILFRIVPTALEISMVCGILTYKFGWDFAAITAGTLAAYAWFTIRTTSWRTKFRRDANQADQRAASSSVDSLINFEAVKHFNNEKYEVAAYDKHLAAYEKSSVKITTSLAFLNSGQNVIFSSALTMTMLMAAQGVASGTMTLGDLVMINQLIFQLSLPLNFLGTIYRELQQNLLDMEVLFKLREDNPPIEDVRGAQPLNLPIDTGKSIRFENVNFAYHPSRPIFTDLSFIIPAGKRTAFVGPSGCGKSTILRLLFRFYDPTSGRILIGDQDISQVQLTSLRKAIGVVPQDTPLFHADVMHNVRYGNLEKDEYEAIDAAKKANVHEAIMRLPEGYKTKVGERGLMISGGEKQRLAVARVLLKDPPILFFDEATSALDAHTEAELMKNINSALLRQSRTSIFIAHRLRTIVEADLIVVLQDGRVAEQGTHEELLKKAGLYYRMWQEQQALAAAEFVEEFEKQETIN